MGKWMMEPGLPSTEGALAHNLVLFGRLLRELGLDVNPGRTIDLIQALGWIEIGRKEDFYYASRSLLVQKREDLRLFDQAFDAFWREHSGQLEGHGLSLPVKPRRRPLFEPPPLRLQDERPRNGRDMSGAEQPPVVQATLTYSEREVLRRKDFSELTRDELAAVKRMMGGLVWQPGLRRSRRLEPGTGSSLDLRRTLRRNLKYGGEIFAWARRRPKKKPRPVVILADVSGSMERYARLLLFFMYSLSEGLTQRVEAFLFSTRLTRVTRQLRGRDVEGALERTVRGTPDWSGGTRIGEALKRFNFQWGRRVLGQGAVVLLISDGWDRGDVDVLKAEMARLQRSCHRLIWLNPLLGSERYAPLTRGMQAALPFVDDFLPVHNLASLEQLARHLRRIDPDRPRRFSS
jgi:uncharacterized protein with von Willebrand factor type A (vWA) domain